MPHDWVSEVQAELRAFAQARDWERYHTPRNLAALIASEAGELLALFRWDQDALAEKPEAVRAEVADVLLGILRFADVTGIHLRNVCRTKLDTNAAKYPATAGAPPDPLVKRSVDP